MNSALRYISLGFLRAYQFVSPLLHAFSDLVGMPLRCKFPVSCSHYAVEQFRSHPFQKALILTLRRLAACSPFRREMSL